MTISERMDYVENREMKEFNYRVMETDGVLYDYEEYKEDDESYLLQQVIQRILTEEENEYPEVHVSETVKSLMRYVKDPEKFERVIHEANVVGANLDINGYPDVGYMRKKKPVRVAVTGAGGAIGYSLIPRIANGELFGPDQPVYLHLIDLPNMIDNVKGFLLELEDCTCPLLKGVTVTSDLSEGFKNVDYAFMVGSKPRSKGMERGDLLQANGKIFVELGRALAQNAKPNVLSLVVGNPANTNCLVLAENAKSIPATQFSALTRLDQNRALAQVANKAGVRISDIDNLNIWGNHSPTMYPDLENATIQGKPALEVINDNQWIEKEFIPRVQNRGAEIINARGQSSAASAADAALKHMRDWALGTKGKSVSMAVITDGSYKIKEGIYSSFPVICEGNGKYKIVTDYKVSAKSKKKIDASVAELENEKKAVAKLLK